jgi:hypothetical protein
LEQRAKPHFPDVVAAKIAIINVIQHGGFMSNAKYIALGTVMLVAGIMLRVYGGETEFGPFELRTVGNVLAIIGGIEILFAIAAIFFPEKKKLD